MSERAALAGSKAEPHYIEHKGKTYVVRPVLTEGVMLAVEAKLYAKALKGITDQRSAMSEVAYMERLDDLRKRSDDGEFAFEHEKTIALMKTKPGAMMLLTAIMDCTSGELIELMAERPADVQHALNMVLGASFPKPVEGGAAKKPKKRRRVR